MITPDAFRRAFPRNAFMHDDEIPALCRYAGIAPGVIVEVGTGWGAATVLLLIHSEVQVYTIDPYVRDSEDTWQSSEAEAEGMIYRALRLLDRWYDMVRLTMLVTEAHAVAQSWRHGPVGLAYIDGDHTYEAVSRDLSDWIPLLCPGGYLLLHDSRRLPDSPPGQYARGWPGPTQAAEGLRHDPTVELIEEIESLTAWRKVTGWD